MPETSLRNDEQIRRNIELAYIGLPLNGKHSFLMGIESLLIDPHVVEHQDVLIELISLQPIIVLRHALIYLLVRHAPTP